jgi:hypothetical protein
MPQSTNVEVVTDLMEFARSGPLMQSFILYAVLRYAEQVANAEPASFESPMLSGAAWHRCGREALDAISAHLGDTPTPH